MKKTRMTFARLRSKNVTRCEEEFEHLLAEWSLLEWAGAMTGEAGEAANVAKKIRRLGMRGKIKNWNADDHGLLAKLADELADTVIYADLTAAAAGIDLGEAVRNKFNRTSEEKGAKTKL